MLRPDNLERHIRNRHPGHVEVLEELADAVPEALGGGQPELEAEPSAIQVVSV